MSAEIDSDASTPRNGPARAILEIDPDDYPDAATAIRAALSTCPTYRCRKCRRERYGARQHCKKCGGVEFEYLTPDGGEGE